MCSLYVFNEVGEEKWVSKDHPSTVSAITWSNKNELATACYGRVTFFDIVLFQCNQCNQTTSANMWPSHAPLICCNF